MDKCEKLLPCPFCGGRVKILICDDEGNVQADNYESNPWSGLSYKLYHDIYPEFGCPIANIDEPLGCYSYNSRQEAINCWNKRFS